LAVAASVSAIAVVVVRQPAANDAAGTAAPMPAKVASSGTTAATTVSAPKAVKSAGADSGAKTVADADSSSSITKTVSDTTNDASDTTEAVLATVSSPGSEASTSRQATSHVRHYDIPKPGTGIEQDALTASTPDWSHLIGPHAPQMTYERATASAAWQLRRSMMAHPQKGRAASNVDSNHLSGAIGFMRLHHKGAPVPPMVSGAQHAAAVAASSTASQ
jgi:hypothetical protein